MGRRRRRGKAKRKAKRKSSKSNRNSSSDDHNKNTDLDLPEDLLINILESFHAKTLCRFRCVSNRWNSIISDPIFVRHYLSRTTCSHTWTLVHQDGFCNRIIPSIGRFNRIYSDQSFDRKSNNNPSAIVSVLDFPSSVTEKHESFPNSYRILASSDGLLLCHVDFPTRYYVCNPIMAQWVALPSNTQDCISVLEGLVTRVDDGGIVASYKVVLLMDGCSSVRKVEIFASDTGEWTTYWPKNRFHRINMRFRPFCFKGILHYNTLYGLIAYDPYTNVDKWRLISLRSTSLDHYSDFLCGVSNGHLSCISSHHERIDVWVLQDYGAAKWHLKYRNHENKSRVYPPLAFHPFDPTIIFTYMDTGIFSYDLVRKTLDMVFDVEFGVLSGSMVLPFVLPPWPTQVPKRKST